jgi:type I restriction enzyme S subunit
MNSSLPSSWTVSTLGALSNYIQRGKSPKYTEKSDLPVINQKCIRWNFLEERHFKFIHPDQKDGWDQARYIRTGDILWNSTGTGTVGRAYLVKPLDMVQPKVVDSHVTIVRLANEVDYRFVFYWIKGPSVQQKIEEMCDGSTNQIELSRTSISATEIPLAPLPEQKRIADKLDTVLARVDACRERLNHVSLILKRFRQSVLAAAMSGTLTEDWHMHQNEDKKSLDLSIDMKWKRVRFADILTEMRNGLSPKPSEHPPGEKILRISSVRSGRIDYIDHKFLVVEEKIANQYKLMADDLLFTRYNGSLEFVGVCAQVSSQGEGYLYPDKLIRVRLDKTRALPAYVEIVFETSKIRSVIENSVKSTSGQKGISGGDLKSVEFMLPSLTEQYEMVRRVEALFAFADRLEARLATARTTTERLTPALLAKAFRGELVPQDPNDEPAADLLKRLSKANAAISNLPQRGRAKKIVKSKK